MELLLFEVIVTKTGVPKTVLRPEAAPGWLWTLASSVLFTETQMATCEVPVRTLATSADMLVCLLSRHLLETEACWVG